MNDLSKHDIEYILKAVNQNFFNGRRFFLTGGTGFFGKWILESIRWAVNIDGLEVSVLVLSRDPERFLKQNPHFRNESWLSFVKGDVQSFEFPEGQFDYIIHGAAEASGIRVVGSTEIISDVICGGTRRVLDFAFKKKSKKMLFISSGAVYGPQPDNIKFLAEDFKTDPQTAYGKSKLQAEDLCRLYQLNPGMEIVIARCFAVIGPFLPFDRHFAAGNFLRDAISGNEIFIKGNGRAVRSYLYMADLIVWLFRILEQGKPGFAYNVGSDERIEIKELANLMANIAGVDISIKVTNEYLEQGVSQYVPCVDFARKDLNLAVGVGLDEAIQKTFFWAKNRKRA